MAKNKELGSLGERKAVDYLIKEGYSIIEQNFKCKIGEIDIIAMKELTLVIVEVKTRSGFNYGLPCESITARKKNHILRTARYYIVNNKFENFDVRIDVIEILRLADGIFVNHIEDAFS